MKLLCLTIGILCAAALAAATEDSAKVLVPGLRLERTLGPGENHVYTARLESGGGIVAEADQEGVDLAIDVIDPDGNKIETLDSPNGTKGPEPLNVTADKAGEYKFVIHTLDADVKPGKYLMKVDRILNLAENARYAASKIYKSAAMLALWDAYKINHEATDKLLADRKGKGPIVEDIPENSAESLVTFIYKAAPNTMAVILNGGPDGSIGGGPMERFLDSDLYYRSLNVPKDARFGYTFLVETRAFLGPDKSVETRRSAFTPDPLNPARYHGPTVLALSEAPPQPYSDFQPNVAAGTLKKQSIRSKILPEERTFSVYTPPGYDGKIPCNLLIVFDGETWGSVPMGTLIPTPTILDNLRAAQKIGPTVALIVDNMSLRNRDLTCNKPFADFVAQELIPWARKNLNIAAGAQHVIVSGSSFGALCSTYCAFIHPEAIGNVVSLSGSYWLNPDWQNNNHPFFSKSGLLIDSFRESKRLPLRFYMEVGRFEGGSSMLGSNRELRDVLLLKGYTLTYKEFDGGHEPIRWRGTLADGLIALSGK